MRMLLRGMRDQRVITPSLEWKGGVGVVVKGLVFIFMPD